MRTGLRSKRSAHLEVDQQLGVLRCDIPYLHHLRARTLLQRKGTFWSEAWQQCPCDSQTATCSQPHLTAWPAHAIQQPQKPVRAAHKRHRQVSTGASKRAACLRGFCSSSLGLTVMLSCCLVSLHSHPRLTVLRSATLSRASCFRLRLETLSASSPLPSSSPSWSAAAICGEERTRL